MNITCENEKGDRITFSYHFPFWLEEAEGLYNVKSEVVTVNNALIDGELYAGNNVAKRNIVLTAKVYGNHENVRSTLEKLFAPHIKGTLTYETKDYKRTITYYAENFEMSFKGNLRTVTVSLICPNPMFNGEPIHYSIFETVGLIHFPINVNKPFQVSNYRYNELINIVNNTEAEQGLIFQIAGRYGEMPKSLNPEIVNVNTREKIALNTERENVTLKSGEYIEISTIYGNKYVDLVQGDRRTRINRMWTAGNTWIVAHRGNNVFRFTHHLARQNDVNLTIIYTPSYWRV